uniref:Family with sequence similarity 110 member D n=1 Tax=Callorhinchus milii TaxID=7868 RepID=A0A4W3KF94_CALMI
FPIHKTPGTPVSSPSPLRLLNRGPEYLRRQMQSDDRSPVRSAVERLEADKAKYVKSQQAMSSRQDPASPSQAASALPGHSRGHGQPNAADLSRLQPEKQTASLDRVKDGARARHVNDSDSTPDTKNDYIFLYPHTNVAISPGICRARLQRSAKVSGAAVLSVNSDPDQRSSAALSEAERFFNECGLDPEVVRQLASARPQPSGTATSHSSEPCGHSADREGIYEEEMNKQVPAEVSVIERNARVIKWLYGCKKAKEGAREGQAT